MSIWFNLLFLLVHNKNVSINAPEGYRDVSGETAKAAKLDPGTVIALQKGETGTPAAASINLVIGEHHPEDKLDDAKQCAAFATEMGTRQNASSTTAEVVDAPTGKTCQITFTFKTADAKVVSTILRGRKTTWVMTCAMRTANTAAVKECKQALATVKLAP